MSWLFIILFTFAFIWASIISCGQVMTNILVSSIFTIPNSIFVTFPFIQSALIILPFLPFAVFLKNHLHRAIFQTWILTALVGVMLAPIQLAGQTSAQWRAVIGIGLGFICIALVMLLGWLKYSHNFPPRIQRIVQPPGSISITMVFLAVYSYSWLIWGSLGSMIDTVLNFASAVSYGILIAIILDLFLFTPLQNVNTKPFRDFLLGGASAGIALMIFASELNFPFGGMQLLLMVSLPGTGWLAFLLYQHNSGLGKNPLLASVILFSIALASPFLFFDPDELALVINTAKGEIATWGLYASLTSLGIACMFNLGLFIWQGARHLPSTINHKTSRFTPIIGLSTVLISWGVGVLLYYSVGQPGWYGEQLFVILKDQEVVSQAADIENYQERREFVYHTLVHHANTTQSELRTIFDQLGLQYQPYYLVNSIRVEGGPLVRLWLMMRPEVDRVLDNPLLRPLPEELLQQYGSESLPSDLEWNLAQIQADRVWQEFKITGEGIVVGQSDSGVQWDHPELSNSYRGRYGDHDYNWLDPWYHTLEPVDKNGHGTHTLGTILGSHIGIAPGATWYACANLARNLGNPAFYLDCLQFMLAPYPLYGNPFIDGDSARGAHVINNSWGCPGLEGCEEDTFLFAVRNLSAAGVFVVASAGNDGPACGSLQYPPANYAELFTVGAIDNMGELAIFSSIGPTKADKLHLVKPDIVAPGMDVLSSTPGDTYAKYSGTSMAGPHVVGVVALMWAANPELIGDIQATKQALIESAVPYSGSLPDCPGVAGYPSTAVGYGILNAYQAVKLALQMK